MRSGGEGGNPARRRARGGAGAAAELEAEVEAELRVELEAESIEEGHGVEVEAIGDGLVDVAKAEHHRFKRLALSADILGFFGVFPEGWVLGETLDFC